MANLHLFDELWPCSKQSTKGARPYLTTVHHKRLRRVEGICDGRSTEGAYHPPRHTKTLGADLGGTGLRVRLFFPPRIWCSFYSRVEVLPRVFFGITSSKSRPCFLQYASTISVRSPISWPPLSRAHHSGLSRRRRQRRRRFLDSNSSLARRSIPIALLLGD